MKGTIIKCTQELVVDKFGESKWKEVLRASGYPENEVFLASADVEDAKFHELAQNTMQILGLSFDAPSDAFGDYWVNVYSQRLYKHLYQKHKSAREFLLGLDDVHLMLTQTIPNARPPRFTYSWADPKRLIMRYSSIRHLSDLVAGLAKAVGKPYQENLQVGKIGSEEIEVVFP